MRVERSRILSYIQLSIACTFLVAVGVISLTMVRCARSSAKKELVERGATVSSIITREAIRALTRHATKEDAEIALERLIYDVRAEEGLEFAFIIDRGRRVIAHSDSRMRGQVVESGVCSPERGNCRIVWPADDFYYAAYDTDEGGERLPGGATMYEFVRNIDASAKVTDWYGGDLEMHVGFALPGFWSFARSSLGRLLPGLVVAFLLLVVGNYAAGVFVKPLSRLKEETATAAKADDHWQLEMEAHGEIADIARNWNDMVEHFRESYHRVLDARREMEVRNRVMLYEKKRTEAIVDSLSDGVMVTDPYGKISFVNRECEALLRIDRDEAANKSPDDVVSDESILRFIRQAIDATRPPVGGGLTAPCARKPQRRSADLQVERKNGTRHVRISHVPVLDQAGKPAGSIFTLRDVTQEKLEESARKEFVSSVTHELRAPLTAIKSYVEMLIDDEAADPDLQREFFNTINEEADRLARLIDDMLNMSKIEVGNLVLNKSLVRTRKLVEDAVNGLRPSAKNKHIELTAHIAEDLPDIEADKELMRVVVTNLLGNGIKYTQEGGKVYLGAEVIPANDARGEHRMIAITVADNGPGIPEDELDKIFEKFYRGRGTSERKVVGNGLGLALAREIAALHGGDIRVESTVGAGSKFTFLLPAKEPARKVS